MARVLVVDDDSAIRTMLCERLNEEGFATLTAWNGQEALEILWKSEEPLIRTTGLHDASDDGRGHATIPGRGSCAGATPRDCADVREQ